MTKLSKQLAQVAEQITALKKTPAFVTFNFFLDGNVAEIWPVVLEAVSKAIGKAPSKVKDVKGKPIEVTFDGETCLVGRDQAVALFPPYALILSMEIEAPKGKGLSRLQIGKDSGVVRLDWRFSKSKRR